MAKRRLAEGQPYCCYCRRQLTPAQPECTTSFTLDHVKSLANGGWRRVPCCRKCNLLKGDLDPDKWFWFIGATPRWWKRYDTAEQVASAVLDECRRRAYATCAALGISTMKGNAS